MNIDVLLVGENENYIKRLTDIMKRIKPNTGDSLNISMFTDIEKLSVFLAEKKSGRKGKYHIALIDEDADTGDIDFGDTLVILMTEESDRNNVDYAVANGKKVLHLYKYQRVSGLVNSVLVKYAKERDIVKKGSAAVYAFFSPQGGCGTSTVAAAYALALNRAGIKPLYVSFEFFNSTELFFNDPTGAPQGLSEIFSMIATKDNVLATIDAIRNNDARGVCFLNKFTLWTEISEINPDEMKAFIEAAQASFGVKAVILDLGSVYTKFTETALDCAEEIFIVADVQGSWQKKFDTLFDKDSIFTKYYQEKINIVLNRSQGQERYADLKVRQNIYVRNFMIRQPAELIDSVAGDMMRGVPNG